jgi:hypothetical protein
LGNREISVLPYAIVKGDMLVATLTSSEVLLRLIGFSICGIYLTINISRKDLMDESEGMTPLTRKEDKDAKRI